MTINWQRLWLIRAIFVSASSGLMAGAMAVMIAFFRFGDFGGDRRLIFAMLFGAFAILLLAASMTYAMEFVGSSWVVRLDESGLLDRRISSAPVEWRDIGVVVPVRHGRQLMLTLGIAEPRSVALPRSPLWRVNRLAARMLGNPELSVRVTGLSTDLFTIMQAIEDHRAGVGDTLAALQQWDMVRVKDDYEDPELRGRIGHVISVGAEVPGETGRMICAMIDGDDHMAILKESDVTALNRKDEEARREHEEWMRSGRSLTVQVDPGTGYGHLKD